VLVDVEAENAPMQTLLKKVYKINGR
jgi:hypothetical protein